MSAHGIELPQGYAERPFDYSGDLYIEGQMRAYARANIAHAVAPLQAEIERLRAEVEASASRVKRLEKRLSAYQTAVNKIDDLIEYSLPMPSETKAALYAVLAILTTTLAKEITSD